MYICICRGITSSQIEQDVAEHEGKPSVREVSDRLGCGKDCGRCRSSVKQIVQQSKTRPQDSA